MLIPTTASAASKHATILFPPGVCHRTPHDQSLKNCFRCAFRRILELWFSKLMRACSISRALGAFASAVYALDGSRQRDGSKILSSPHVIPPTYRFRSKWPHHSDVSGHRVPISLSMSNRGWINPFTCQFDSYEGTCSGSSGHPITPHVGPEVDHRRGPFKLIYLDILPKLILFGCFRLEESSLF